MPFSKRLDLFGEEIFASLNEKKLALEKEGRSIYNMSIGTPDFPPPRHIMDALAKSAMNPASWKYSLQDLPELKQAVVDYYRRRYGVFLSPDEVMSCYGTQEGV
ncbi:MAG: LL-diaminopimelate aminotransferase, partial [Clostridia bacterium]|nr:LL-diaminopimelate aminotransferase [Clostridia bacterium]